MTRGEGVYGEIVSAVLDGWRRGEVGDPIALVQPTDRDALVEYVRSEAKWVPLDDDPLRRVDMRLFLVGVGVVPVLLWPAGSEGMPVRVEWPGPHGPVRKV